MAGRSRIVLAVLVTVLVAAGLVLAGCGESDPDEAQTPANSPTVVNSAAQTDSEGNTVTAPAGGETTTGGGETTSTAGGGGTEATNGDAAAGKTFFEGTCQGCHLNGGQQAGAGPKLSGLGLAQQRIHDQVVNGGAQMPAGLASGTDLDNVVAYVLSIQ